jgi:hypothetical protein
VSDDDGMCPICHEPWDRCPTRDVQGQVDRLRAWAAAGRGEDPEGGEAIEQP